MLDPRLQSMLHGTPAKLSFLMRTGHNTLAMRRPNGNWYSSAHDKMQSPVDANRAMELRAQLMMTFTSRSYP